MPNSAMSAGITAPVNGLFSTDKPGAPLPAIPQQPTAATYRIAIAKLSNGASIPIACPAWCTTDHGNDQSLAFFEDVDHCGPRSSVEFLDDKGGLAVDPLDVRITQDPCNRNRPGTRLVLTDEDGGREIDLTVDRAMDFAQKLIEHGQRIQQLATQYAAIQAAQTGGA